MSALETKPSFRLSRREAALIAPGLRCVVCQYQLWEMRERKPSFPVIRLSIDFGENDKGEFNPEDMTVVVDTLARLNSITGQTRRFRMDAIGIAACILGARVAATLARHGHIRPYVMDRERSYRMSEVGPATRRLIAKLERLRNRAKRAFAWQYGHEAFAARSCRWRRFVRFVRVQFLFCTCHRRLMMPFSRRKIQKLRELELIGDAPKSPPS